LWVFFFFFWKRKHGCSSCAFEEGQKKEKTKKAAKRPLERFCLLILELFFFFLFGQILEIRIQGVEPTLEFAVRKILVTADLWPGIDSRMKGDVKLPTKLKRFTLLKSPFKHKKAQNSIERRMHYRLLSIEGSPDRLDEFKGFVLRILPEGMNLRYQEKLLYPLEQFFTPPPK
jgi:small subunit ribosomal protein S10